MNVVLAIGRLGHDPETQQTSTGLTVCRFPLASNEVFLKGGEKQERVTWLSIVVWKNLAETCGKFLKKGSLVLIRGKLQNRQFEYEGEKRTKTEIVASEIVFLERKKNPVGSVEPPGTGTTDVIDDGVPF